MSGSQTRQDFANLWQAMSALLVVLHRSDQCGGQLSQPKRCRTMLACSMRCGPWPCAYLTGPSTNYTFFKKEYGVSPGASGIVGISPARCASLER